MQRVSWSDIGSETMAENPSQPPVTFLSVPDTSQHWCYHCDKRVSIETVTDLPNIICSECKKGFVESISSTNPPSPPEATPATHGNQDSSFTNDYLDVLRLFALPRDDTATYPNPNPVSDLSGTDNSHPIVLDVSGSDEENESGNNNDNQSEYETEEDNPRVRGLRFRDMLRNRMGELAARAVDARSRNQMVNWSDILMELGEEAIRYGVEMPYPDDPEDFIDALEYEGLLRSLENFEDFEEDIGGAPPAARSVVLALEVVEITGEDEGVICAICKELVAVGDKVRKLGCGHGYHEDCILQWLGSRNSCPICRFELPTDDPEYEERKRRLIAFAAAAAGPSGSRGSTATV